MAASGAGAAWRHCHVSHPKILPHLLPLTVDPGLQLLAGPAGEVRQQELGLVEQERALLQGVQPVRRCADQVLDLAVPMQRSV